MRHEERAETGRLLGLGLRGLTGVVRDVHGSIATTTFGQVRRWSGPLAAPVVTPVEIVHDTVARGVYGITGRALEAGAEATGRLAAALPRSADDPGPLADHRRARTLMAVLHGFQGDALARAGSVVAYPMTLRRSGSDVPLTTTGLAQAYPDARRTAVVFVHGFIGTEQMWKRRSDRDPEGRPLSFGRRLERDGDVSAVWVRYNTGLRVSTNGRHLRDLLRRLHARWPVPLERIVLVGHSMGGLVAHSALAQSDLDEPWVEAVTDTITLGTPHHGTPLERVANSVAAELADHDRTRWVADLVRLRSDGIRDMRHGNLVDEDWQGHDPEDPADRRTHARPHEHVHHLAVVATVAQDPDSRLAGRLGDLVVSRDSARGWAHADEGAVGSSATVHLGGLNHLDLLSHPRVYDLVAGVVGVEPGDAEPAHGSEIAGA